jgi:hypothetical protein
MIIYIEIIASYRRGVNNQIAAEYKGLTNKSDYCGGLRKNEPSCALNPFLAADIKKESCLSF